MITKNYIKMCEKAEEIQKACKYEGGEIFSNVASEIEIMPFNLPEKMKEWYKYYYHIWLPTQEQLQEMSSLLCNFPCRILTFLNDWIKENKIHLSQRGSMNELWLAFVMKERWNKEWRNGKWIIIK